MKDFAVRQHSQTPCSPSAFSINIKDKIITFVHDVERKFQYNKDNLLCLSASIQPNFLVWSSALALHDQIGPKAREVALSNVREELFGLKNEGCHALLAHLFFKQVSDIEIKHYEKTENDILEIHSI